MKDVISVIKSRWFLNLLVAVMIAGLVALLVEMFWSKALHSDFFAVSVPRPDTPEWLDGDVVWRAIQDDEYLSRRHSTLEPDLERRVAERLAEIPWVKYVIRVKKTYPNRLDIKLEYRRPVAEVVEKGVWYLVDEDGVCLGPEEKNYYSFGKLYGYEELPSIQGAIKEGTKMKPGHKWSNEAVASGARLAATLVPLLKKIASMKKAGTAVESIVAVDVSNFGGRVKKDRSSVVLLTTNKEIRWGHTAVNAGPDEQGQKEKLTELTKFYDKSPTLEKYNGVRFGRIIDIRWGPGGNTTSD